jgi:hypothetical protein
MKIEKDRVRILWMMADQRFIYPPGLLLYHTGGFLSSFTDQTHHVASCNRRALAFSGLVHIRKSLSDHSLTYNLSLFDAMASDIKHKSRGVAEFRR